MRLLALALLLLSLILNTSVGVWGVELLPIDPAVGSKGDVSRESIRKDDSAHLEVTSYAEWEPWHLVLGYHDGKITIRVLGWSIYYDITQVDDTSICLTFSSDPTVYQLSRLPAETFHLYVTFRNDSGHYLVEVHREDSLRVLPLKDPWFVTLMVEKALSDDIVLVQLQGNVSKLTNANKDLIDTLQAEAKLVILKEGYYARCSEMIRKSKKRRRSQQYNFTNSGRVLAFKLLDEATWTQFQALIAEHNKTNGNDICQMLK